MIAKSSTRKSNSNFVKLARYIGKKAIHSWTANCSEDLEIAAIEIAATQDLNTKSRSDRTYHLIVAFPIGERPALSTLRDIEHTLTDKLGYSQHQRLIAIHDDTDYMHMHVAISKIHPSTLNNVTPYRDYRTLAETCRDLEKKYALQTLLPAERPTDRKSIEVHQGLTSFETWIKENARTALIEQIPMARKWEDLHKALAAFGAEFRLHGAGLVISQQSEKLFCKASSIDRQFSKSSLEKKLGPFESRKSEYAAQYQYNPHPVEQTNKSENLYNQYKDFRLAQRCAKDDHIAKAIAEHGKEILSLRLRHKERHNQISFDRLIHPSRKREIHRTIQQSFKNEISRLSKKGTDQRKEIRSQYRSISWKDWLCTQVESGSTDALSVLRSGNKSQSIPSERIEVHEPKDIIAQSARYRAIKSGIVEYTIPGGKIFDQGKQLWFKCNSSDHEARCIEFIIENFGNRLSAIGTERFVKKLSSMLEKKGADYKRDRANQDRGI